MSEINPAQTHALLEKLAEYVMTQVPMRREVNERFDQIDARLDRLEARMDRIEKTIAAIQTELDLFRAEHQVFTKTFALYHQRLEMLEDQFPGYRIRDGEEEKGSGKV